MLGQLQITRDGQLLDKVDMAIRRLQAFCPPEGYYVAFSGGKDSQCVYHLCKMSGIKFDAHYNVTSVDPPELIRFIRKNYPEVHFDYPRDRDGKVVTMWNLIPRKQMPPTRLARYCCEWFKESSGKGRITVTGVRWAESARRAANQGSVVFFGKPKTTERTANDIGVDYKLNKRGNVILNDDNDEARRMVERCPMSTSAAAELAKYPVYRRNYVKAFDRMIANNKANGIEMQANWKDGESVMRWWLKQEEEGD